MKRSLQYLAACDQLGHHMPPPMPSVLTTKQLFYDQISSPSMVSSVFGSILKMDSTKKVAKNLAEAPAETIAWVTNVGSEYGQVVMSMLTSHECQGLLSVITGLVNRYKAVGVAPPTLLYVARDCCSAVGLSRAAAMFSHSLYGLFMAKLSVCIFMWDEGDVTSHFLSTAALEGPFHLNCFMPSLSAGRFGAVNRGHKQAPIVTALLQCLAPA